VTAGRSRGRGRARKAAAGRSGTDHGATTGGAAPRIPGGIPDGAAGIERDFYAAADGYLDDLFGAHPAAATAAGLHRHDARLDDWSAAAARARLDMARRHQAALTAFDPAGLSPGARIDRGLVLTDIEGTIFGLTDLRTHEHDPQFHVDLLGNAVLYLTLLDPDSPAWPDRLEALLGRLRAVPDFLATARSVLREPARITTDLVLQTNAGNLRFFETGLPPLFARAPALEADLRAANQRAVTALREFQDWVRDDLLPRSTGDWRLGRDRWSRKLRLALQSDMDPDTIARRARSALDSMRARMLAVAEPLHRRLFPGHQHAGTGDERVNTIVGEVVAAVSERHPARDTLFQYVRDAVGRIKAHIRSTDLITLPPDDDNFAIEPTPGFLDGMAVAFFNPPPTLEPHLKKSFWISSLPRGGTPEADRALEESFLREYNDYALQGLAIHEAFPGHYVQYWHALRSPFATVYKKVFSSGTFAEGWAVLAENQMFDGGYAADEPENMLIHLKHGLRAPLNALLDAGLHTSGEPEAALDRWALDLMQRTGFQEEAEARGKLRRAKVTSTQLSTYFVGVVEMTDILEDARRAAGGAFRLRDFNDRLLSFGTIPPRDARAMLGLAPR
jgi:uncharacterized protein (DUF885 family)